MIKEIKFRDLYDMKNEYLVFQGCGGDLQEWYNGIAQLMVDEGCAKKGYKPKEMYHFEFNDISNVMIPIKDLDLGRLAIVRLKLREVFGAMWLSDYIANV